MPLAWLFPTGSVASLVLARGAEPGQQCLYVELDIPFLLLFTLGSGAGYLVGYLVRTLLWVT